MKKFANYSKLSLEQLEVKAEHHQQVVDRLKSKKLPCYANILILNRLRKIIKLRRNLMPN